MQALGETPLWSFLKTTTLGPQIRTLCKFPKGLRKSHFVKIPPCEKFHFVTLRNPLCEFCKKKKKKVKIFFYSIHPNFISHFSTLFRALLRNFCMTVKNLFFEPCGFSSTFPSAFSLRGITSSLYFHLQLKHWGQCSSWLGEKVEEVSIINIDRIFC